MHYENVEQELTPIKNDDYHDTTPREACRSASRSAICNMPVAAMLQRSANVNKESGPLVAMNRDQVILNTNSH